MTRRVDLRHPLVHQGDGVGRELVAELVRRRRNAGLSQTELAKKIGTSQRTVSQLENLTHEPKLGTILSWARAVGLRLYWGESEWTAEECPESESEMMNHG